MYRKADLQYLQDIFDRSSNEMAVLYGSVENDLPELVSDFIKDKDCLYFRAGDVCDSVERQLLSSELHEQTRSPAFPDDDYEKLISSFTDGQSDRKKLIVFDDFQFLVRNDPTFINFLTHRLFDESRPGTVMYLLVSDDISWVENDMIRLTGRKSYEIAGVIKLKDHTPSEFGALFPKMPVSMIMGIWSVIGGNSRYYSGLTDKSTVRDVVIKLLTEYSDPYFDTGRYLPRDIREPQIYNSILVQLAAGCGKLGDIHSATHVDRAKLSVYLKTLTQSGMTQKAGTAFYRINDPLVKFYYRFVFPHFSSLKVLGAERFYRRFIEHEMQGYIGEIFPVFCMEQIRWLQGENRLNFKAVSVEEYPDRTGAVDFLIVAAGGSVIACACRYEGPHMSYRTYEEVRSTVRKKKLICDNIWLFSASGFDQKLTMFASVTVGVKLIDASEHRLH